MGNKKYFGIFSKKFLIILLCWTLFLMIMVTFIIVIPYAKNPEKFQKCYINEIDGSISYVNCNNTRYLELKNKQEEIFVPFNYTLNQS